MRLIKRDLLFVVERLASLLDENRLAVIARQHGVKGAKDSDSIAKLYSIWLHRAEESLLGRLMMESTIVRLSHGNEQQALRDVAAVYKVDNGAIAAKVRQNAEPARIAGRHITS